MTVALLCLVAPGTAPTAAPGWPWASNHRNAIMTARRPRKVCSAALKASPLDQEYAAGTSSAQQGPNGDTHSVEEELLAPGRQYALAGDLESAVIHFERAATQAPRSAVCKAELGRVLVRLGRAEEGFNSLVDAFGIDSLCPGIKDGFREYYRAEIQASSFDSSHRAECCCKDVVFSELGTNKYSPRSSHVGDCVDLRFEFNFSAAPND